MKTTLLTAMLLVPLFIFSQCDFTVDVLHVDDLICTDGASDFAHCYVQVSGEFESYALNISSSSAVASSGSVDLGDGIYRFNYLLEYASTITFNVSNSPSVGEEDACNWSQSIYISAADYGVDIYQIDFSGGASCPEASNGQIQYGGWNINGGVNYGSADVEWIITPSGSSAEIETEIVNSNRLKFTNLEPGYYEVSFDNSSSCDYSGFFTIGSGLVDGPTFTTSVITPVDQNGEEATVEFDFSTSYQLEMISDFYNGGFSSSPFSVSGLTAGTHEFTISSTTAPECSWEFSITIDPYVNLGCLDAEACNYEPDAESDDGSCTFPGCTDPLAENYDPQAGCEGLCDYAADFNNDGYLDGNDFIAMLGNFGCQGTDCLADLNNDGLVNTMDLLEFLSVFNE